MLDLEIQPLLDAIENYSTLIGSRVDPNEGNKLLPDCDRDRFVWWRNGGIADKIATFWADEMGTGLEISVAARDSGRGKKESARLQDWLASEYDRLNVLATFKQAELQCNLDRAAPILICTQDRVGADNPPEGFDRVMALKICEPARLLPHNWETAIMGHHEPIDHDLVLSYQHQNHTGAGVFHADRVLALQGRKLVASDWSFSNYLDRQWGLPLIATHTIEAAMKYDVAIALANVLLHKKSTIVYKFKGLFESVSRPNAEELVGKYIEIAQKFQQLSNLLNISIADSDLSDIDAIDRNLTGVSDVIDRTRDYLLANCPSIPQSHLFGRHERTGGLSASNDESEDVNARAERLYRSRWLPLLRKLNRILIKSSSCPVRNADPSTISVLRSSGFTPDPLEAVQVKQAYVEIDEVLVRNGAIDVREMRSRHIGSEFKTELLLESPEPPQKETETETLQE